MARTGRPAKPAALKRAQGNPGRRSIEDKAAAPELAAAEVVRPSSVTGKARKLWEHLAPQLRQLNFLRPTDAEPFARYCDHVARYWEIRKDVAKEGEVYLTESRHGNMLRLNPKWTVLERLETRLEGLEDRFGLSPRARQQIMLAMAQHPLGPLFGAPAGAGKDEAPAPQPEPSPIGMLRGGDDDSGGPDLLN